MRPTLLFAIVMVIGLGSCADRRQAPTNEDSPPDPGVTAQGESALKRAREAANALGADLMSTMANEMASGGPVAAVRVCSEVAQQISEDHSQKGLTVRRVTMKARNPLNRPDSYERTVLERFQALHAQGDLPPESVEVVDQQGVQILRYMRPIQTANFCLACHGDAGALDPQVREILQERYPEDAATGYQAGDLRGAISVQAIVSGQAQPGGD